MGFRLSRFSGFPNGGWIIAGYNKANELIAKVDVPAPAEPEPTKDFFGIWCSQTFGRINIFDKAGLAPDAIDDIELWEGGSVPVKPQSWGGLKLIYR